MLVNTNDYSWVNSRVLLPFFPGGGVGGQDLYGSSLDPHI